MARVGYFEGTDSLLLSMLAAEGVETLPLANTIDGHGKNVNQLHKGEVNVVVGYFHKLIPAEHERTASIPLIVDNRLSACRAHNIPVLLIVPAALHDKAENILRDIKTKVHFVAPEELETQIRKYL